MPFRDIIGHDRIRALISAAALRGTLPPSLIFSGPDGIGKHMTAVALAQIGNCLNPTGAPEDPQAVRDACGECQACRRIARRVHADVLFLAPGDSGSIKTEDIRDAVERSAYRPFEGKRRFVIIDHADQIVPNGQDALLKTLEEPPGATTFVLVTSAPSMLLPTILSRCQRLRFGRLSPADVARVLMTQHDYSETDAHAAASLSDGSIGQALEAESDAYVAARGAAVQMLAIVAAEPPPARRLQASLGLPGAGRGKADRDALAQSLRAMASVLRDIGLLGANGDVEALANADLQNDLDRLLRSFNGDRVLRAFAAIDRALEALERNASPKIVADWLAFQI